MRKKGFTLVELMIVVTVLGILVAIAIPVYNNTTENAARTACMANLETANRSYYNQLAFSGSSSDDRHDNIADTVLTVSLKAESSNGKYTGLCPSGGYFTLEKNSNNIYFFICSVHGADENVNARPATNEGKIDKLIQSTIDTDGDGTGDQTVLEYFQSKLNATGAKNGALNSQAPQNNDIAGIAASINQYLSQYIDMSSNDWRIYYLKNPDNPDKPSQFNYFWTDSSISDIKPGTKIEVTKYDAVTDSWYKTDNATVRVETTGATSYNIIDVSAADIKWTSFNP